MPLADSHLHLFRRGYAKPFGDAWSIRREVELYELFRKRHKIDMGLVVGYEGLPQFRSNNHEIAAFGCGRSWIKPLAYCHLVRPPSLHQLQTYFAEGFVGIAIYATTRSDSQSLHEWPQDLLDLLNQRRCIISLNARPASLAHLKPWLERLENCRVLISHLGLPGTHRAPPPVNKARVILRPLAALSKLPHVGVKLSGFYAISSPSHDYPHPSAWPFLQVIHDTFGADRLYWGSDFSPALEHLTFAQTIDAISRLPWSKSDLQKIMGENLRDVVARVSSGGSAAPRRSLHSIS